VEVARRRDAPARGTTPRRNGADRSKREPTRMPLTGPRRRTVAGGHPRRTTLRALDRLVAVDVPRGRPKGPLLRPTTPRVVAAGA